MDEMNPKASRIVGVLDAAIKTILFLIVLLWITGGFTLTAGPLRLSVHKVMPSFVVLVVLGLVRWLLTRVQAGAGGPFRFSPRLKRGFMRLMELGIAVHVVLIPIVWNSGHFHYAFFSSVDLSRSLGLIFLMLIIRLVMGRNLAWLTAVISIFVSLLVVFYGLEIILRTSEARQLRQQEVAVESVAADTTAVVQESAPDRAKAVAENPGAPGGEEAFDPGRNDGVHWTWGNEIINNKYGFREDEFEVPKADGVFRIMILGDSLTWGAGLAPSQRYSGLLEAMLSEAVPDQPLEVLNFGFQGGPTIHERDLLERLHEELDPDLIVVGFCLNDPQPRSQNYSFERERLHDFYNLIAGLRHVGLKKTYAFIISRINNVFVNLEAIPSWQEALDRTYDPESREWREFVEALEDIKRISDLRNLHPPVLILLVQGMASDNPQPPYEVKWFAQVREAAERKGFLVVDPSPRFVKELTMADIPVNPRDGHPSAACNLIYAEQLLETVLPLVQGANTW